MQAYRSHMLQNGVIENPFTMAVAINEAIFDHVPFTWVYTQAFTASNPWPVYRALLRIKFERWLRS